MLTLRQQTSHRMQLLDVTFFGPLNSPNTKVGDLFIKGHIALKIICYDVVSLMRKAFNNVTFINTGKSGIFSINPKVCKKRL